jgi:hypothetical protein
MGQLLLHFRSKEREKSRTHIGSIQKLKPSKHPSWPLHFEPTDNRFDRAEIVRWVSENTRPFSIVSDRGFKNLMKTGRPDYYLPSPSTVSRDVRVVFARSRQRIAALLRVSDIISEGILIDIPWQKHDGKLHFATDAWTSPNHRAFVAVTVHFEHKGSPICMILDVVEVAKVSCTIDVIEDTNHTFQSHSGVNLAEAFAAIVEEFGISDKVVSSTGIRQISYSLGEKVLGITCDNASNNDAMVAELEDLVPGFSRVNHTRCFLHVNNLVARTLVRQFDIPKATATANGNLDDENDDPDEEIRNLAGDIDLEERQTREALLEDADEEIEPDDMTDEWVDEMAALSQAEREKLQASIRPLRMILVKVSKKSKCVIPTH